MKIYRERLKKIITYILVLGMAAMNAVPVAVQAATTTSTIAEKKSDITTDSVLEMSSDSTSLNQGDEVEVKFAIHNTATYGFSGSLEYDTDVFNILEVGKITPSSYVPKDEDNQSSWSASYWRTDDTIEAHWRGDKAVTLPEETKGVVLTIRLVVKKTTESTKIGLKNPKMYKSLENSGVVSYPDGLSITLKNHKLKKMILTTLDLTVTGNTVAVPVSCSTNEGFTSLDLVAEFDKTKLQYQSVTIEDSLKNYVSVVSYSTDSGGNKVTVKIKASQEVKNTGRLFTVNFTAVRPSGSSQTAAVTINDTVKLSVENVQDQDGSEFVLTGTSSKVTVNLEAVTLGDINGNKKVDLVDALYIVQYYNKVRYLTTEQKAAADVNKSGTVDLVDALLIMQYYNGVIKNFP